MVANIRKREREEKQRNGRHLVMTKVLVELPLEFGRITCTGIIGTCNCFGSICESRGLSNLKTREIKTI